ncbi:MAG: hypothetical protein WCG93_14290 [Paludibacter sp.]
MAAKHFMIYYQKGSGTYIVTEPRPWARENKHHFPDYDFVIKHPTSNEVDEWLIKNKNFKKVINTNEIILVQNIDPNLVL